jgi:hypothetical protein
MAGSEWRDRLTFREFFMIKYEFKVVHSYLGKAGLLTPQEGRDRYGPLGLEKTLNGLADEGWEIVSCTTSVVGSIFALEPWTTVILRREKT